MKKTAQTILGAAAIAGTTGLSAVFAMNAGQIESQHVKSACSADKPSNAACVTALMARPYTFN